MSRKSKRTSAPTPMEIPPPVAPSGHPPRTQLVPPPPFPSVFGPASPTAVHPSLLRIKLAHRRTTTGDGKFGGSKPLVGAPGVGASPYHLSVPNREEFEAQECNGSASQSIHIDDDNKNDNCTRTEKCLTWTEDEDLRLVGAWLNNSNDPIKANCKKNDQYWKGVADVFSSTTAKNRVRSAKQIKDHFGRIKKRVAWFCGNWKEANAMWSSGESDADVMKRALKSYEVDHKKDGPFMFMHCWEVLSKQPKWDAYLERLEDLDPEKRKFSVDEDMGKPFSLDDARDERPIGGKKAKEQLKKKKNRAALYNRS